MQVPSALEYYADLFSCILFLATQQRNMVLSDRSVIVNTEF